MQDFWLGMAHFTHSVHSMLEIGPIGPYFKGRTWITNRSITSLTDMLPKSNTKESITNLTRFLDIPDRQLIGKWLQLNFRHNYDYPWNIKVNDKQISLCVHYTIIFCIIRNQNIQIKKKMSHLVFSIWKKGARAVGFAV